MGQHSAGRATLAFRTCVDPKVGKAGQTLGGITLQSLECHCFCFICMVASVWLHQAWLRSLAGNIILEKESELAPVIAGIPAEQQATDELRLQFPDLIGKRNEKKRIATFGAKFSRKVHMIRSRSFAYEKSVRCLCIPRMSHRCSGPKNYAILELRVDIWRQVSPHTLCQVPKESSTRDEKLMQERTVDSQPGFTDVDILGVMVDNKHDCLLIYDYSLRKCLILSF